MKLNHIALSLIAFIAGLAGLASLARPAFAQSCTTQYGGTTTCVSTDLTINKQVRHPINPNLFVENLGAENAYAPGADVEYLLIITNASGQTLSPVTVTDVLPQQLSFQGGPGSYTSATRTLTFTIDSLTSGQTVRQRILAKVRDSSAFKPGQDLTCEIVNTARVNGPDGRTDDDTASLCVRTNVLGATTLPVAGYNDLILLLPFAGMGLGGLALLKRK